MHKFKQRSVIVIAGSVLTGLLGFTLSLPSGFSLWIGFLALFFGLPTGVGAVIASLFFDLIVTRSNEQLSSLCSPVASGLGAAAVGVGCLLSAPVDLQAKINFPIIAFVIYLILTYCCQTVQ